MACAGDSPGREGSRWLTDSDFVVAGVPDDADSSDVLALLGEPDSIISLPDPDEPDIELLAWTYPDLAVAFGDDGLRYGVTLTGPGLSTARGLRPGDSEARVRELYGSPHRSSDDSWDYVAPDDADGLHVMRVGLDGDRVTSAKSARQARKTLDVEVVIYGKVERTGAEKRLELTIAGPNTTRLAIEFKTTKELREELEAKLGKRIATAAGGQAAEEDDVGWHIPCRDDTGKWSGH